MMHRPSNDLPNFLVIGAMKCSTSTLHDQLNLQPGISMSDPKEPNFFSDGPNFAKGMDWYRGLFSSMPTGDLKGESSTHLTKYPVHPDGCRNLHAAIPGAKLVYIMRDPVNRLVSQFIHEWSERSISIEINRAVREYPRLLSYSSYAMQLEPYIRSFGQHQILPVFFERLLSDPQIEFERICTHIGYDGVPEWFVDRRPQNVSSNRNRWPPMVEGVLRFPIFRAIRRAVLPESLRNRLKSRWIIKDRPTLSDESIAFIHDQLDPDIEKLGKMIGRPMSCTSFREQVCKGAPPEWIDQEISS